MEELFMRAQTANFKEFGRRSEIGHVEGARALVQLGAELETAVREAMRLTARLNEAFEDGEKPDVVNTLAHHLEESLGPVIAVALRLCAHVGFPYPDWVVGAALRYLSETSDK